MPDPLPLWRILDANRNRCNEGLRVLEDWCRFVGNHPELSQALKTSRHQVQQLSLAWSEIELLKARDAAGDVGREITTSTEHHRPDQRSVLQANFLRVQQSLRVIEETTKLLELPSHGWEQLRYQIYDQHRQVILFDAAQNASCLGSVSPPQPSPTEPPSQLAGQHRRLLLQDAQLYVLTDLQGSLKAFLHHLQELVTGGAQVVQIRDKRVSDSQLLQAAIQAVAYCRLHNVLLIVNDRPDLAVASDADGVHVGQDELPVGVVRQLIGPDRLIGLSTHDRQQVENAHRDPCDYLGVGPVFPSSTKTFQEHVGPELLQQVASIITKPAFAIGGIHLENLDQVQHAGFQRVAVQGAVGIGSQVVTQTRRLRQQLRSST